MKQILFIAILFTTSNCYYNNNNKIEEIQNETVKLKNRLSKELAKCVPDNWIVWEEYLDENKTALAHIGKGIFEIHLKAKYQLIDTAFAENVNGKIENSYYPEIILHIYKNDEYTKESVKFTQENPDIISHINFAVNFGETSKYLIYECTVEKHPFEPKEL